MAKITPSHLISDISGKICKKDTSYIALNRKTGKMYTGGYHGCVQPNSEEQQKVKQTFTSKSRLASAWWKANKPSAQNVKGTESYQLVMQAYKVQNRIGNPYNFLRQHVTADLKIVLGTLDITNGVKAPSSSDTGGSSSGGTSGGGSTPGVDG